MNKQDIEKAKELLEFLNADLPSKIFPNIKFNTEIWKRRDIFKNKDEVKEYIEESFDSDSAICYLKNISIMDRSIGADLYSWDFGDGSPISTSPGPELDHYYINVRSSPVNYTVELKVENEEGCSHQFQKDVIVYPESEGGILKGNASPIIYGSSTG